MAATDDTNITKEQQEAAACACVNTSEEELPVAASCASPGCSSMLLLHEITLQDPLTGDGNGTATFTLYNNYGYDKDGEIDNNQQLVSSSRPNQCV